MIKKLKLLEWTGALTAIIYSLLVALNIEAEFMAFVLLLISASLIGLWSYLDKHRGIIGMVRWYYICHYESKKFSKH